MFHPSSKLLLVYATMLHFCAIAEPYFAMISLLNTPQSACHISLEGERQEGAKYNYN